MEQKFKIDTLKVLTASDGYVFCNKEKTVIYGKELTFPEESAIEEFDTMSDEEHFLFLKNEKWKSWGHKIDPENPDYIQWINQ